MTRRIKHVTSVQVLTSVKIQMCVHLYGHAAEKKSAVNQGFYGSEWVFGGGYVQQYRHNTCIVVRLSKVKNSKASFSVCSLCLENSWIIHSGAL